VLDILSDFEQICILPADFHKSLQYQISRRSVQEIRPAGALSIHADRRRDGQTDLQPDISFEDSDFMAVDVAGNNKMP
jgi:hypothetical protein